MIHWFYCCQPIKTEASMTQKGWSDVFACLTSKEIEGTDILNALSRENVNTKSSLICVISTSWKYKIKKLDRLRLFFVNHIRSKYWHKKYKFQLLIWNLEFFFFFLILTFLLGFFFSPQNCDFLILRF